MTVRGLLASLVMVFGLAPSSGVWAQVELRALAFQPESVSLAKHFYRWVRAANERCRSHVRIVAAGPEDTPSELQWHALKQGRIDMYYGPANYYRGVMTHADVLNLGRNELTMQRRNGAWAILNDLHKEHMNAHYLTSLISGVRFFIFTNKPLVDGRMEGLRIRAVPLYEGFLRTLGAEPRFMPAGAVRAALEKGEIDGYGWPLWSGGLGWEQFVKFRHGPGFLNTQAPILVNLDRWNALSDEGRQCLTEMAAWLEQEWPAWRAEEDRQQVEFLAGTGIEYVDLGGEFAAKPEAIYWGMLNLAQPEYVKTVKHLFAPEQ